MKKILLINPKSGFASFTFNEPLALGVLAALTPDNYEIEIIDENFEAFKYTECDILAISCSMTATINRAYFISGEYMKKGIPTVIGGLHASYLAEEASQYFTSVVVGDAESVWGQLLNDFENNRLKKLYGDTQNNKRHIAFPKRSVFNKYPYVCASVETSRGCNQHCEYCSVPSLYKHEHYERPIDDVLEDIKTVADKVIFFTDDNFISNFKDINRIEAILNGIIPLNVKWAGFCTLDIVRYPNLLKLFKKSGCVILFIGMETDELSTLEAINKPINHSVLDKMQLENCVKAIHKYNINVMGFQIFGFDTDKSIKDMHLRMRRLNKSGLDWFVIFSLTPIPGSRIRKRLVEERRILYNNYPVDWALYDFTHAVFEPKNFKAEELDKFFVEANTRYYNRRNTFYRLFRTLFKTKSVDNTILLYIWIINNWSNVRGYWFIRLFYFIVRKFKKNIHL
jgi:radical SAM superfamily enzyme YgiQ (UPF0313 family)